MRAVQSGSELGADASGQLGGAQAFYGVLGDFSLPLWSDGGRVDKRYPVDYLQEGQRKRVTTPRQRHHQSLLVFTTSSVKPDLFDLFPDESGDRRS